MWPEARGFKIMIRVYPWFVFPAFMRAGRLVEDKPRMETDGRGQTKIAVIFQPLLFHQFQLRRSGNGEAQLIIGQILAMRIRIPKSEFVFRE